MDSDVPIWEHTDPTERVTDAEALPAPIETTPASAQSALNFVAFEPTTLPRECEVTAVTRRPERPPGRPAGMDAAAVGQTPWSEGNPCSLRLLIEDDDRRLRLKQFLYDWAPPAASIAPLWGTPEPVPVRLDDVVAWLGTDYKDNRGACLQRERTQVELSVLEGTFGDDELRRLMEGLAVAKPTAAHRVRLTPFFRLSYWSRYGCRAPAVPHGAWECSLVRPFEDAAEIAPSSFDRSPVQLLEPADEQFRFDSGLAYPTHDCAEIIYRHSSNASDHLWLFAASTQSETGPSIPPEPAEQPAAIRDTTIRRDTRIYFTALVEDDGAWEAYWRENGTRYAAWAGASLSMSTEEFLAVIEGLSPV